MKKVVIILTLAIVAIALLPSCGEKVSDFQNRMNDSLFLYESLDNSVYAKNNFVIPVTSFYTAMWMRCNKFTKGGAEDRQLKTKKGIAESQIDQMNALYKNFNVIRSSLYRAISKATVERIYPAERGSNVVREFYIPERIEYYDKAQQPYVDRADSLCKELRKTKDRFSDRFLMVDKAVEDYVREMDRIAKITQIPPECETPLTFSSEFLEFVEKTR